VPASHLGILPHYPGFSWIIALSAWFLCQQCRVIWTSCRVSTTIQHVTLPRGVLHKHNIVRDAWQVVCQAVLHNA